VRMSGLVGCFLGRPRGRNVDSRPRRIDVEACQSGAPNGWPRRMLRCTAFSSAGLMGALTRRSQSAGRSIGQGGQRRPRIGRPGGLPREAAPRPLLGVGQGEPAHEPGEVAVRPRPDDEMEVVGHDAVGEQSHVVAIHRLGQKPDERLEVAVVSKIARRPLARFRAW
jgi:hypothetical protein